MADPFVAEIRIFGFNFAPTGWAFCNGQLLPISQNTALFSLLGTTYGGNGKSNFALPNMSGNVAMQPGQGPGLSLRDLGEQGGSSTVTLLQTEMPVHNHMMQAVNANASTAVANGNALAKGRYSTGPQSGAIAFYNTAAAFVQMDPLAIGMTGGNLPHNNMMPFLALNYCIALQGVFPPRP
ncbi:phage tail protein [Sphingosinicella sp. BN140058]|uniref:phage tail protein n=1 Tax=Sphingosinicella sp. BN140058 TaxID=1892855 RepID=UPI001012A273|nr:tail fiber protein [Sphingosinicella sp. BN140058]QAY77376.1 phage tail protein [Sphingosinicella sp. BN140058]